MLIATFNASTGWRGKTITFEDDHFVLEGHGHVSPKNIMKYDEQGQLVWASDGMRAWVGSHAKASASRRVLDTSSSSVLGWVKTAKRYNAAGDNAKALHALRLVPPGFQLDTAEAQGIRELASSSRAAGDTQLLARCNQLLAGAPQPPAKPRGEISGGLGIIGVLLVIGGLLVTFYFLAVFDVSVEVPYEYSAYDFSSGGERVNNIGLMNDQRNGIIGGVVVALVGGVLLFIAYSRGELDDWLKRAPAAGERKCPYCAERIKAEAVVCRHCNREVPRGGQPGAVV